MTLGTSVPISIRFSQVEQTPLCLGPAPSACPVQRNQGSLSIFFFGQHYILTAFLERNNGNSSMHLIGVHLGGGADGIVALWGGQSIAEHS